MPRDPYRRPPLLVEPARDWRDDALCAQLGGDLMFPPEKQGSPPRENRQAKEMCSGCDVRTKCLDYAIENQEVHGIWGGLNYIERRQLARERQEGAA